ncbi:ribose 5-phosphate isomerase B [Peptoniphilus equinus]|uniref:Ribose 5-phosphate isomerase B n=1 Tax=Peptoniphilus equinus TaxID=3016343 RepID=A0ABY7QWX5_9FIRM|nr:ribose 5-phosphate isomerase B [Peptoniphilus equinus]WBW50413.1 ribose 5-phosphate isomerase B [Peptoniphilus equinus]
MKLGIGSDHAGFDMKTMITEYLKAQGHTVVDYGTDGKDSVDYPDYGKAVGRAVVDGDVDKGILICGTGVGISISANKVKGVRACVCSEPYSAQMSVRHNNANIIAFGARVVGEDMAKMIVDTFLGETFEGGRHERRVGKIEEE